MDVRAAIGVHPSDTGSCRRMGWLAAGRGAAAGEGMVAIGEISLDYYWEEPGMGIAEKWFPAAGSGG